MSSSTFSFKDIIAALLLLGIIELGAMILRPESGNYQNILTLSLSKKEPVTRLFIEHKLSSLKASDIDIVQIGDSSGFYGVQPRVVMSSLEDMKYVNFSCNARSGVLGALAIADSVVRESSQASMLVYHATPYYIIDSSYEDPSLIRSLKHSLQPPYSILSTPLMSHRIAATNLFSIGTWRNDLTSERVNPYWGADYEKLKLALNQSVEDLGWMPRPGSPKTTIPSGPLTIKLPQRVVESSDVRSTYFYQNMALVGDYCRNNQLRLVIIFNPIPQEWSDDAGISILESSIDAFLENYPECSIPFPLITTLPLSHFMDRWHLTEAASIEHSQRLGEALKAILSENRS